MLIEERVKLASMLQITADMLDVPDHVYEDATLKYEDVGEYLASDDSDLYPYKPQIYVQGSFRLGTVVQPYGRNDEYDIDLVCLLEIKKDSTTQRDLKNKVGDSLKKRADLAKIIDSSRRCWTLNYPSDGQMPSFHMDVLPTIPNIERFPTGILITDTELIKWQKSNPIAYAEWFKSRMETVFRARKFALAESLSASIDEVPDWRVKTPLQRCVQILKRHRDIYFAGKPEVKPVSIILTTLAAHVYQNEEDIFIALTNIAARMPLFIENRDGVWWVQNLVDDGENFADKWNEHPERRAVFMEWLEKVGSDIDKVSRSASLTAGLAMLDESLGQQTMNKVATAMGVKRANMLPVTAKSMPLVPALGDVSHVQSPLTQFQLVPVAQYNVKLQVGVYFKKKSRKGRFLWPLTDKSVPKNVWLKFTVKTNLSEPYSVKWQVVNTGDEAIAAGQPRGDFYESDEPNRNVRWESTAYRGTHWVEAFIINSQGTCVAQSGRYYVKVR